ncbi:MAG: tripartite tricarboxylate transporter substrate binding protein, partial [Burkholderiales bacterium]|nr:tripartite tricarboxylate transporter substrate binding protein [Burkholderiales bacterium]
RPAIAAVARSPADGYTFVHGYAGTFSINPGLYRDKLEYSPEKDFVPVAALFTAAQILVINPSILARTVAEFVRYAKANPDKVPFASAGIGSSNHFSGELLKSIGGFDALHVPFNGSAPAHVALIGGHVMWSFDTGNILQHVRSGRLVALGAAVSQRLPALPDLPTIAETYPGFEARTWHGLFAPAGTPPEIVALVNRIVNEAMTAQQGRELLAKTSLDPFAVSPEAFGNFVRADMKKWTEVAVKANIQAPD